MPTIEPKEQLTKVTVLLPKDTIDKLDSMANKALMGSRGRVIQSLVDGLWDSQGDIQAILNSLSLLQTNPQQKPEELAGMLFILMFPVGNVLSRVNKYLGIVPNQPVFPTQMRQQAPLTKQP